jgi:hypothetical protein
MGSLGSTENIQTVFELLPFSVEHVRWNSRDRIPDTGLQVIKCVNWCLEYTALDTSVYVEVKMGELYFHSFVDLHGVVLN